MAAKQITPRVLVLAAIAVAAGMVLIAMWPPSATSISNIAETSPRDQAARLESDPSVPPALGLEGMEAERAVPANRRDLFRFGAATPDAAAGDESRAAQPPVAPRSEVVASPNQSEQVPPPVTIPLRYVGYAEYPSSGRVATLADGRFTYYGREGDVIEGKWRLIKVSADSVVIEKLDGTGRETLRLAGG
jgi:hypothetical protein